MTLSGIHNPEQLTIKLNSSESERLKKKLIGRIQHIQKEKKRIQLHIKDLVWQLEKNSRAVLKELEILNQSYVFLLGFEGLSNSLKKKADKVIGSTLKVKEINFSIRPSLTEGITKGLLTFVENSAKKSLRVESKVFENSTKKTGLKKQNEEDKQARYNEMEKNQEIKTTEEISSIEKEHKDENFKETENMITHDNEIIEDFATEEKIELVNLEYDLEDDKTKKDLKLDEKKELEEFEFRNKERLSKVFKLNENEANEKKKFIFRLFSKSSSTKLLKEKEEFMNSLEINGYISFFGNKNKVIICDIKLSNDGLFSFICKI